MSLATRLKAQRTRTKKSLQDVANETGSSKAHIWDLETDRAKNPSIDLLIKLARCFDVGVADLVGENPEASAEDSRLVAMYRDLKELSPKDRETIQMMMKRLQNR